MKGVSMCLAIEEMKRKAAEKAVEKAEEKERIAVEKERISTLFKNIENLMEKAGWSAEQSMDMLDVSVCALNADSVFAIL